MTWKHALWSLSANMLCHFQRQTLALLLFEDQLIMTSKQSGGSSLQASIFWPATGPLYLKD
jgi:hypothetical protein